MNNSVANCSSGDTVNLNVGTEVKMALATVFMVILCFFLVISGIVGRYSGQHMASFWICILLQLLLELFLPSASYLLSEVRQQPGNTGLALLLLLWILVVELIRKKVSDEAHRGASAISGTAGRAAAPIGSSWINVDNISRLARALWIAYLLIDVLKEGRACNTNILFLLVPAFAVLWLFNVIRAVRDFFASRQESCLATNLEFIAAYMIMQRGKTTSVQDDPRQQFAACKYVIAGEDQFRTRQPSPDRYSLEEQISMDGELVTVGKMLEAIRRPGDEWKRFSEEDKKCMSEYGLSFALFKLLQRKFDGHPIAEAGSPEALDFVLKGLMSSGFRISTNISPPSKEQDDVDAAEFAFRIVAIELGYLEDYNYSSIPATVTLTKLLVFLNVILNSTFTCAYYLAAIIVFLHWHLLKQPLKFSLLEFLITLLLPITVILVDLWDLVNCLLSNWFMASVLSDVLQRHLKAKASNKCDIVKMPRAFLVWIVVKIKQRLIKCRNKAMMYQANFLDVNVGITIALAMLSELLKFRIVLKCPKQVPREVKRSTLKRVRDILENYASHTGGGAVDSIRRFTRGNVEQSLHDVVAGLQISTNVAQESVTEVILICHIATALLELHEIADRGRGHNIFRQMKNDRELLEDRNVAISLSNYCAYLVTYAPDLLPGRADFTRSETKRIRLVLMKHLWRSFTQRGRYKVLEQLMPRPDQATEAKAFQLGRELIQRYSTHVWKHLADFWVNLVVYIAVAADGEMHANALARNTRPELVTLLWVIMSHAGVLDPPYSPH